LASYSSTGVMDLVSVLAGAGLLNVLSFLRLGGLEAFNAFQANMAVLEALDTINVNTPDPWRNFSVPRVDWIYLAFGLTGTYPSLTPWPSFSRQSLRYCF